MQVRDKDLDMDEDHRRSRRQEVRPQWVFAILMVAVLVFLACAHYLGEN
jgi:hypothetical protein